ncbi:MAG: cold shock domain-containing protein [Theionarchaea archaeon]|nr:MAG: cold-shock protein [Theionarchaea archaeon DG-70-1]MBU7030663.1 cold shock domain-containing protein [Theionarchaea archaeon]
MKGTIHWYSPRKGFGFIQVEGGKDVFVHQNAMPAGVFLDEGDHVEFEQEESNRGPRAADIRKI